METKIIFVCTFTGGKISESTVQQWLVEEHALAVDDKSTFSEPILLLLLEEAHDPSLLAEVLEPNFSLPFDSKRELIDVYIMMKLSSEEISTEMENTTQYYLDRKNTLQKLLESFSQRGDAFGRGAVALLQDVYLKVDRKITECTELFAVTDSRSPFLIDGSDSESSDIESDDDCFV